MELGYCLRAFPVLFSLVVITAIPPSNGRVISTVSKTDQQTAVMSDIKRRIIERLLQSQLSGDGDWQLSEQQQQEMAQLVAVIGSVSDEELMEAASAAAKVVDREDTPSPTIPTTTTPTPTIITTTPTEQTTTNPASTTVGIFERYAIKHGNPFYTAKPDGDGVHQTSVSAVPTTTTSPSPQQLLHHVLHELADVSEQPPHQLSTKSDQPQGSPQAGTFQHGLQLFSHLYGSSEGDGSQSEVLQEPAVDTTTPAPSIDVQRLSGAVSQLVRRDGPAMLGGLTAALQHVRAGRLLVGLQTAVPALTRTTTPLMHALSALAPVLVTRKRSTAEPLLVGTEQRRRQGVVGPQQPEPSEPFTDPYQVGRLFGSALKLVTYVVNFGTYVVIA